VIRLLIAKRSDIANNVVHSVPGSPRQLASPCAPRTPARAGAAQPFRIRAQI
jgi:hypothetical protein